MAIPHLVVVALIMGELLSLNRPSSTAGAFSILNVLVVIAGAFLVTTALYPQPLFNLLLAMNRWVYRVVVYVAFMRDGYPPFQLDSENDDAHQR